VPAMELAESCDLHGIVAEHVRIDGALGHSAGAACGDEAASTTLTCCRLGAPRWEGSESKKNPWGFSRKMSKMARRAWARGRRSAVRRRAGR
jgi:hypothetical protein